MPDDQAEFWHVADAGKSYGPYTANMLEARVAEGRFTKMSLVWKPGMSSWQPMALHFTLSEVPAAPPKVIPEVREPAIPPERPSIFPAKFWIVLAGAVFFFALILSGYSASDEWSASAFLVARTGSIIALVCLASLSAVWWWKWAGSDAASARARGITKVVVVLCGTAAFVAAFVAAVSTPFLYRLQIARQSFNHYLVSVDVGTGTLLIKGTIGPGMAAEVGRQLDANAAIRTVAIDSIGGLLDEALRIAHDVQAHHLATQVRRECNSACILVFMAGTQRAAPYNFTFGFHASSSVTPMHGTYNLAALDQEKAEANAYLRARGVPNEFIEGAKALGPDKLYQVSSILMADDGVVTTLLDGADAISSSEAKWLTVVDSTKQLHQSPALVKLLLTIAMVDPAVAQKYGPIMWTEAQYGRAASVASAAHEMVAELTTRALPAADDKAVALVAKVTSDEMQYIRASGNWAVCAGFISGNGFGATKPPPQIQEDDFLADVALITSAAQNSWNAREVRAWATKLGAETAKELAAKMFAQGINVKNVATDPRVSCEWATGLLAAISEKPTPVAAGLYRWLAAGGK